MEEVSTYVDEFTHVNDESSEELFPDIYMLDEDLRTPTRAQRIKNTLYLVKDRIRNVFKRARSEGWPFVRKLRLVKWIITALTYLKRILVGRRDLRPYESLSHSRSMFRSLTMPRHRPQRNHTHGPAAARRNDARLLIFNFAKATGRDIFSEEMSRADVRDGYNGSRHHHWTKDVQVPRSRARTAVGDVSMFIDVDYYVDMPSYLAATKADDVCVYTIIPEAAAKVGPENYMFKEDGSIRMDISGGASYEHKLWNYTDKDNFYTCSLFSKFAFTPRMSFWLVDSRKVGPDRYVINLTRTYRSTGLTSIYDILKIKLGFQSGHKLRRLSPVVKTPSGKFTRISATTNSGLVISTGRPNTYLNATISASADSTLASMGRTGASKLTSATIKRHLGYSHTPTLEEMTTAATLKEFHRNQEIPKVSKVSHNSDSVHRYTYGHYEPDSKTAVSAYMNPLVDGAFSPDITTGNAVHAVQTRIKSLEKEIVITKKTVSEYMTFLDLAFPNKLLPVDYDVVYARQERPTQRRILDQASDGQPAHDVIKSFLKRETYQLPKDPRIISQISGDIKLEYARYIYAISDSLCCPEGKKRVHWNMCGRTPQEIACAVANCCIPARFAVNFDNKRMDGTLTSALRDLDYILLAHLFNEPEKVISLYARTWNIPASAGGGGNRVQYIHGTAQASGSMDTSIFTTVRTGFEQYLGHRALGKSPEQAWHDIGPVLGDDSVAADLPIEVAERAARTLGLVLTHERIERGQTGVSFLSRIYGPDIFNGDPNSCCDILRVASKFHTTTGQNVDPVEKLADKAFSVWLMDEHTPMLGAFVRRAMALDYKASRPLRTETWWARYPKVVQYPNRLDDWMETYVWEQLDTVGFNHELFDEWLKGTKVITDLLLCPPLCEQIPPDDTKIKADCVVDGENIVAINPKADAVQAGATGKLVEMKPKPKRQNRTQKYREKNAGVNNNNNRTQRKKKYVAKAGKKNNKVATKPVIKPNG